MSNFGTWAIISDIHGNSWALDAVLEDIRRRNITRIINLGDSLYGPLDPLGTAERLSAENILSIRGNQDRIIISPTEEIIHTNTYTFVKNSLTVNDMAWIESLPVTLSLQKSIFLCHGTPSSDETYLLEEVTRHGVFLKPSERILEELANVREPIVLCAHSHIPRSVYLPNGQLIINPGSVGLPAYSDDVPHPHCMESGSPHAKYVLLSKKEDQWMTEHILVPYNWHAAADCAYYNGREDWATCLLYGRI